MDRAISSPPNNPVERAAGSHSLAAAAHRARSPHPRLGDGRFEREPCFHAAWYRW